MLNVNPALSLNKNQEFNGVLQLMSLNFMHENLTDLNAEEIFFHIPF